MTTTVNIALLGAPGSGKGTQAEMIAKELHLPHVATGDLFRDHLKQQTALGLLARTYMDRGELVPDDVTDAMVEERLTRQDTGQGFILDGFPRTLRQAQALTEILRQLGRRIAGVAYLNVPDAEIVQRLSGRWICRHCQAPYHARFKPSARPGRCDICNEALHQRDDDQPRTVLARLRTFHAQSEPVIQFYRGAGLLWEIDGSGTVETVASRVAASVVRIQESLRGCEFDDPRCNPGEIALATGGNGGI
jgi:adenylate kinase